MSYFSVQWYRTWINCGDKLFQADKEDYLVVKLPGLVSFMNKQGKMYSKYCPLYIHFKAECLKEYARRIHDVQYGAFPFSEIMFGKDNCQITRGSKSFPWRTDMNVSNN